MTNEEKVKAFKKEIIDVCKKHNLSISHQDEQGAFVIMGINQQCVDWFNSAKFINDYSVMCSRCERHPNSIDEYVDAAKENDTTPEKYVISEEGTYNKENGHFYCTDCYTKLGMPLGVAK